MISLRPTVFDLQTDDWNPNVQFVNTKCFHHETYKRFWNSNPANFTKKSSSREEKLRVLFSFHLFYLHNTSNTIGSLRNFDSLKEC